MKHRDRALALVCRSGGSPSSVLSVSNRLLFVIGTDELFAKSLRQDQSTRVSLHTTFLLGCRDLTSKGGTVNRLIFATLVLTAAAHCWAGPQAKSRAVETLLLQDGTRLLGVSWKEAPADNDQPDLSDSNTVRFLVRTEWLRAADPEFWEQITKPREIAADKAGLPGRLERHLQDLRASADVNQARILYFEEELAVLKSSGSERLPDAVPDLLQLVIPQRLIKRRISRPPLSRHLTALSMLNGLRDTEKARPKDLQKTLAEIPVDKRVTSFPGSDQDGEVFQRLLLNADRRFGRTSKLILLNDQYFSETSAAANPQALMTQMLARQVQSQIQDLLADPSVFEGAKQKAVRADLPSVLPAAAAAIAGNESADLVEVKLLQMNPTAATAQVRLGIYRRDDKAEAWALRVQGQGTASSADVDPEAAKRILQDDRVQQAGQLFAQLGLQPGQLQSAVSIGAIVEAALVKAQGNLNRQLTGASTRTGPTMVTIGLEDE